MNFLGLKKMILKGKDFVMKKLDELEIERQDIDYVSEQIPKRLHTQLKTFEKSEIDLEPGEEYSEYFKIYPTHPVAPVLYDSIQKIKEQVSYEIAQKLKEHELQIPQFNKQQQQRAFKLKTVVDNYKEPIPHIQNPMVGIFVVNFHHKRGTEIQFKYPDTPLTQSLENRIAYYAMPDSSHNKDEDYNFFNIVSEVEIEGEKRMLFGVSYFKQIKLTDAHKEKQQELTRSHLQKAVCVVSVLPVFGYLKVRLAQTTKLFFEDFTNFESIRYSYEDLSKHLNDTWMNIDINELYIGTDLRNIIGIFGHKVMEIYKAILYEKRIVIFSHSPSSSSSFILSLLTLFPGMITFGMSNNPINKYYEALREFALPLRLFSKKNPLILSFHIQQFHLLDGFEKPQGRHYLVGTTNRLVKQTKKFSTQVLLNLQNCTMQMNNIDEGGWEGLTSRDKIFINNIIEVLSTTSSNGGYKGSEDWIREQFHNYLKQSLIQIVEVKNLYRKFIKECEIYQASLKNKQKTQEQKLEGESIKLKVPMINSKILDIPFPYLLSKPSFSYFLQFHNPLIYLLNPEYSVEDILLLGQNDCYLGKLPRSQISSIRYFPASKKLRYSANDSTVKQVRFNPNNQIVSIEIGKLKQNSLLQGFRLNQTEFYMGDLVKNQYQGSGKLITDEWTYIGTFNRGKLEGEGQLVTKNKVIYMGQFKNGKKEGKGRQQDQQIIQVGMFSNDYLIQGQITQIENKVKISGHFVKGKVIEKQKYMYVFPNEDSFFGELVNSKPYGQGIFTKWKSQSVKALFENGVFVQEIEDPKIKEQQQLEKQAQQDQQPQQSKQSKQIEQVKQVQQASQAKQIEQSKQSKQLEGQSLPQSGQSTNTNIVQEGLRKAEQQMKSPSL